AERRYSRPRRRGERAAAHFELGGRAEIDAAARTVGREASSEAPCAPRRRPHHGAVVAMARAVVRHLPGRLVERGVRNEGGIALLDAASASAASRSAGARARRLVAAAASRARGGASGLASSAARPELDILDDGDELARTKSRGGKYRGGGSDPGFGTDA